MSMRFSSSADTVHSRVAAQLEQLEVAERKVVLLRLMSATGIEAPLGECRLHAEGGYPAVRPVLKPDGLHWCCLSDQEHCSRSVVALETR